MSMRTVYLLCHEGAETGHTTGPSEGGRAPGVGRLLIERVSERTLAWPLERVLVGQGAGHEMAEAVAEAHPEARLETNAVWDSPAGGESGFWERTCSALDQLLQTMDGDGSGHVAVVCDDRTINALVCHFMGRPEPDWGCLPFLVTPGSTSALRTNPESHWGTRWVRWVNDVRHLEGLGLAGDERD